MASLPAPGMDAGEDTTAETELFFFWWLSHRCVEWSGQCTLTTWGCGGTLPT